MMGTRAMRAAAAPRRTGKHTREQNTTRRGGTEAVIRAKCLESASALFGDARGNLKKKRHVAVTQRSDVRSVGRFTRIERAHTRHLCVGLPREGSVVAYILLPYSLLQLSLLFRYHFRRLLNAHTNPIHIYSGWRPKIASTDALTFCHEATSSSPPSAAKMKKKLSETNDSCGGRYICTCLTTDCKQRSNCDGYPKSTPKASTF